MKKEFLGQPLWLWGIGAAVIVGGYLWIRHSQSTAAASQGGTGNGQGGSPQSTSSFNDWIRQHDSSPSGSTPPPPTNGGAGPERKWLIHKTGSKHPWTFLARHHERIEVGPTGSRKIVKDG